jgi:hypothetical protein
MEDLTSKYGESARYNCYKWWFGTEVKRDELPPSLQKPHQVQALPPNHQIQVMDLGKL